MCNQFGVINITNIAFSCYFMSLILLLFDICQVNVTELILNAVSLSIILDIDNYIFGALASTSGKDLIHYLQPLQVPPYARLKGTDVKSAIMCIAVPGRA